MATVYYIHFVSHFYYFILIVLIPHKPPDRIKRKHLFKEFKMIVGIESLKISLGMDFHSAPPVVQTVSQVQVHRGGNVSTPHSLLFSPPPQNPASAVTAWRYYDRGPVALLW